AIASNKESSRRLGDCGSQSACIALTLRPSSSRMAAALHPNRPRKGASFAMQSKSIKQTFLVLVLGSLVPLAACGKDTPTAPTQSGPTVTTTPAPAPTPAPEPTPTPTPTPTPPPSVTLTGTVVNLARSGEGDLDISFRIDDFTIVRAKGGTPVMSG